MKISADLDANGFRVKNVGAASADTDAVTLATLAPFEIADGETFRVPAGKQVLYHLPITSTGTGSIRLDGALVEV